MNLTLKRTWLTAASTVGSLYVDGVFECFVLEDRYRPPPEVKVPGATCIPEGRYRVIINRSPSFSERAGRDVFLPRLLDVPGFEGVLIHPGNTPADTKGCLLPGKVRHGESVRESNAAFVDLFKKLRFANDPVWLTIELAVVDAICL